MATTATENPQAATASPTAPTDYTAPSSVLIIGSGVFGLSTAWSLAKRPEFAHTTITVLDRSPEPGVFPARDAASIDSSRIIRADYADPAYAALACEALAHWRSGGPGDKDKLGGEGRYTESGFLLVADDAPLARPEDGHCTGMGYAKKSWINSMALAQAQGLPADTVRVCASRASMIVCSRGAASVPGDWGYLNTTSGWADAEAAMKWTYDRVVETGRVVFKNGTAESLVVAEVDGVDSHEGSAGGDGKEGGKKERKPRVTGAKIKEDGTTLTADLVIVAAGAWSPSLIDLSTQAVATGQVLAYLELSDEEQRRLEDIPVLMNISTGLFVLPPRNNILKVARHSYGYLNPTTVPAPAAAAAAATAAAAADVSVSQPWTHLSDPNLTIPAEGRDAVRECLRKMIPWPELRDRPFSYTRMCWYTDTPTSDWILDYHPSLDGLFVATGGSGHGFKFLPVIGDKIVDRITGVCPPAFLHKWDWKPPKDVPEAIVTEDGSRGGKPGLVLKDLLGS